MEIASSDWGVGTIDTVRPTQGLTEGFEAVERRFRGTEMLPPFCPSKSFPGAPGPEGVDRLAEVGT